MLSSIFGSNNSTTAATAAAVFYPAFFWQDNNLMNPNYLKWIYYGPAISSELESNYQKAQSQIRLNHYARSAGKSDIVIREMVLHPLIEVKSEDLKPLRFQVVIYDNVDGISIRQINLDGSNIQRNVMRVEGGVPEELNALEHQFNISNTKENLKIHQDRIDRNKKYMTDMQKSIEEDERKIERLTSELEFHVELLTAARASH